jgi:hypothetical protein
MSLNGALVSVQEYRCASEITNISGLAKSA